MRVVSLVCLFHSSRCFFCALSQAFFFFFGSCRGGLQSSSFTTSSEQTAGVLVCRRLGRRVHCFTPMLFVASNDKSKFVDLERNVVQQTCTMAQVERRGLVYCATSRVVIAHQSRSCASFFSPCRQQPLQRCFTPETITCSACTMDGVFLLAGAASGNVYVWNTLTGQLLHLVRAHSRHVTDIAISSDQSLVVTASEDSVCKTWTLSALVSREVNTPGARSLFTGHTLSVNACSFMETGYLVLTGSSDRSCRIFDSLTGHQQLVITVNDPLTAVRSSPGDEVLLLGSSTGSLFFVKLYAASKQPCLPTNGLPARDDDDDVISRKPFSGGHEGAIVFIWFDVARPGHAIVGSSNGAVLWWNSITASTMGGVMEPLSGGLTSICYVPKDALLLSSSLFSQFQCTALAKHPIDPATSDFAVALLMDECAHAAVKKCVASSEARQQRRRRQRKRQQPCVLEMEQQMPSTREGEVEDEEARASCSVKSRVEAIERLQDRNRELLTLRDRLKDKLLKLTAPS